jgi:acyl transferase domain-containing protein/NAD(P)H-dependent flavin oxidoreductase YrpB (nitropropane dioxygenase family)
MASEFSVITATLPGLPDPGIALAGMRSGAIGLLDLEHVRGDAALRALERFARRGTGRAALKIDGSDVDAAAQCVSFPGAPLELVVIAQPAPNVLDRLVRQLKDRGVKALVEVTGPEQVELAEGAAADGIVAKGHEAGGWVGEETTFILLQRAIARGRLPVWAHGGVGLHSAAACYAAGAAGILLDGQLALVRESALDQRAREALGRLDGSETSCVAPRADLAFRAFARPRCAAFDDLRRKALVRIDDGDSAGVAAWREHVRAWIGWQSLERQLWPLGQDVAFAEPFAARFRTVGGVVAGIRDAVTSHVRAARATRPLDESAPLAQAHGTRFPIVQGPMTRVSDTAGFAAAVSDGGALPFLALALMRAPEVTRLLEETTALLNGRAWGVGILGFVPPELREEQLDAARAFRPPFALIAGGRPDQARVLDEDGIATYLHVPSPALLKIFLDAGARRFVFEGRECGGHVGPRSSFVLWDSMVDVLLSSTAGDLSSHHVLFAGGIHDALSASMVATLAAPLAERGARIGVLLGTAYLFTDEAVSGGAVVEAFQREALACAKTVLLETGPGHAIRCVETPYRDAFEKEKQALLAAGRRGEDIRLALEDMNVGRLRIASKGIVRRNGADRSASPFVEVPADVQRRDGMYMIGQLAALRRERCTIASLHHDVGIGGSARLDALQVPAAPAPRINTTRSCDVAIVGMGCLLPKAPDLQSYWENILGKVDAITEVPVTRWDWRPYFDADQKVADKVMSRWGGFIDDVVFDPIRYGMPPSSLRSIEPLQLLALEAVRMALDDAGYDRRDLPRDRTAVIVGAGGGIADLGQQYAFRSALPMYFGEVPRGVLPHLPEWTEDSFAGLLVNVVAGRVANRFDLGGPNYTVDAACASSLAAVYLAVRELELGTSDVVIAAGADTMQNPFAYTCFSKTQALSPRGRCRPFDSSADGIAISEGLGVVVLKRLDDAERDGDRIYAVIKGVAGASDGRGKGLTAPRVEGQVRALENAYAAARVEPSSVRLVEAHGTGTVVGDQTEIEALSTVFAAAGAQRRACAIGSVKSMIGHTKCAAGLASLIKVALALHHRIIPPTIGVERPNAKARLEDSPFFVSSEAMPWCADASVPRRAGISAFGFGGTNFHAVVEEYGEEHVRPGERAPLQRWPAELCVFSGESRAEIDISLAKVEQALERGARPALRDLAFTLWQLASERTRRSAAPAALSIVASSIEDLREKIAAYRQHSVANPDADLRDPRGIYISKAPLGGAGRVAILFPGQGSQYPNMLRDLFLFFPELRAHLEEADRTTALDAGRPLSADIFPPPWFTPDGEKAAKLALTRTTRAQPALAAVDLAAFRLFESLGLKPDAVAGHSFGEYVALCAAGAMSETTLLRLAECRARLILEAAGGTPGTMAAADSDGEAVARAIRSIDSVWIANLNSPKQTIIAGTVEGIASASEALRAAGVNVSPVAVSCAFHSPVVAGAREPLRAQLRAAGLQPAQRIVFSNTLAAPYPSAPDAMADLLADHLARPVNFCGEIEAMYEQGARIFIELGPRSTLTSLVGQTLEGRPHAAVAIDSPGRPALVQLLHAVARLMAERVSLELDRLFAGRGAKRIALDTLVEDAVEKPLDARLWLVNGGRARPAHEPSAAAPTPVVAVPIARSVDGPQAAPPLPALWSTGAPAGTGAVMQQHQELMNQFLETQRRIMLAYLRGGGVAADVSAVRPIEAVPVLEPIPVEKDGAAPVPQAAASAMPRSIERTLLSLVQERTGYPLEMLDLDANLEADLGIDSIKRVEILAAFQKAWFGDAGSDGRNLLDRLSGVKTLRHILQVAEGAPVEERRTEAAATASDAPRPRPAQTVDDETEALPRLELVLREAPCGRQPLHAAGAFVITDDGAGVADAVLDGLRAEGIAGVKVRPGGELLFTEDSYAADLTKPEQVNELVRAIHSRAGAIAGLVHLVPLRRAEPLLESGLDQFRRRCAADVKSLFNLASALHADLRTVPGGRAAGIFAAAHASTHGGDRIEWDHPAAGGVAGLIRTLAVELDPVRCRTIAVDAAASHKDLARYVVAELAAADAHPVVCYDEGRRLALLPEPSPLHEPDPDVDPLGRNSVVLVTGGARGITAAVTATIARRYRPRLVIVGRSPAPSPEEGAATAGVSSAKVLKTLLMEQLRRDGDRPTLAQVERAYRSLCRERAVRSNLREFETAGAAVTYLQVDVRDAEAFGSLIRETYTRFGRIDGVVHGAGVIEDKLHHDKSAASFDRVFDTKADSTFVLARELRADTLKFLVLFSSVAGTFGSRGQCDYTAANGVLNACAAHLDARWPARFVAINWGPWQGTGMVAPEVQRQFEERGIRLVTPSAGCRSFDDELRRGTKGDVEIVLGWGPWLAPAPAAATSPRVLQVSV